VQLSGVIITYNEEKHIKACIESMLPVVDEIIVIDSFSTDNTKEICLDLGVTFIEQEFLGFRDQKNIASEKASHDIILSLDADERVSQEMKESILAVKTNWKHNGYSFNRLNNYCGTWLKRSWYPDNKIRLWDKTRGTWGRGNIHEGVELTDNDSIRLDGNIVHYAYKTIGEHKIQIDKFAKLAAKEKYESNVKPPLVFIILLKPLLNFLKIYVFKFGFLDGYYGFQYAKLSSILTYKKYLLLKQLYKKES
ncbi:MAG: glycosyltransferase family 2 protein, partial [Cyclobacteriaceae bacterium]